MNTGIIAYNAHRKQNNGRRTGIRNRNRLLIFASIYSFLFIACIGLLLSTIKSNAADTKNAYKYYTSIQVHEGESLWSIADQYLTPEYQNHEAYMEELMTMNHLTDSTIHAGQYLTIPYFSYEYKE